jgi:hypothetical protein
MQVAIIENNAILQIDEIARLFPNVSFPASGADEDFLAQNSAMQVIQWEMFDSTVENLITVEPYIKDNKVYTCLKVAKTQDELAADAEKARIATELQVRNQRTQLLKDSDWTQVADAPVDKVAWAIYRQELRDITSQVGFPSDVVFPNPPL